jgi:hypothetical protein
MGAVLARWAAGGREFAVRLLYARGDERGALARGLKAWLLPAALLIGTMAGMDHLTPLPESRDHQAAVWLVVLVGLGLHLPTRARPVSLPATIAPAAARSGIESAA